MQVKIKVEIATKSDTGRVRKENQDRCDWFHLPSGKGSVLIVADGMGGYTGGSMAAQIAVDTIGQNLRESISTPKKALQNAYNQIPGNLAAQVKSDITFASMGTTASMLLYTGNKIYPAHIGDSRIYKINQNEFSMISEDHSLVHEMVKQGILTEEEAVDHPDDNILVRALTANSKEKPDIYRAISPKVGDAFVVCSDGLWKMVTDDQLKNITLDNSPEIAVEKLVNLANTNGGIDNVTVGIMKFVD